MIATPEPDVESKLRAFDLAYRELEATRKKGQAGLRHGGHHAGDCAAQGGARAREPLHLLSVLFVAGPRVRATLQPARVCHAVCPADQRVLRRRHPRHVGDLVRGEAGIDTNRPLKSGIPGHACACAGWKRQNIFIVGQAPGRWLQINGPWPRHADICQGRAVAWEDWNRVTHTSFIYVRHA